jgi:hypothetical protein
MLVASGAVWASGSAPPYLGERLEYTASYEGLLSGGQEVDVAQVVMSTQPGPTRFNGERAYRTRVQVSTAPYDSIERLFPLRYEYNSLLSADLRRSLMFEQRKEGRRPRHVIVWFDWDENRVARFRRGADSPRDAQGGLAEMLEELASASSMRGDPVGSGALASLVELGFLGGEEDYEARAVSVPHLPDRLFDRLSMLQVLRLSELEDGTSLRIPVSDGERLLYYTVRSMGRERLKMEGRVWDTYRVRLSAVEAGKPGPTDDPPVDLWLAADARRIPVRLSSEHRLGRFEVRLQDAGGRGGGRADVSSGGAAQLAGPEADARTAAEGGRE